MKNNLRYFIFLTFLTILTVSLVSYHSTLNKEETVFAADNTTKLELPKLDWLPTFKTAVAKDDSIDRQKEIYDSMMVDMPPAPVVAEVKPETTKQIQTKFRITSYYLNIREKADPNSKILGVLEQNNEFEIVNGNTNTWVELSTGGFINSKYTELVGGTKTDNKVTIASTSIKEKRVIALSVKYVENTKIQNPLNVGIASKSNLTVKDLSKILKGTALSGIEGALIEVETTKKVNALYVLAVAQHESLNGTSKIALKKNNLFGLNAVAGDAFRQAFSYDTKSDSVLAFGEIMLKYYINKGYNTLDEINKKYAEDTTWKNQVGELINYNIRVLKM